MATGRSLPPPRSSATLRSSNQRLVLDALRHQPSEHAHDRLSVVEDDTSETASAFTQAELARLTGLAPATISNIVRDLSARGLVSTEAGSGRRGSSVRLSPDAGVVAGVDFGHSHLAVGIGTIGGQLLDSQRRRMAGSAGAEVALTLAASMLGEMTADRPDLLQVGLGVPAPVTQGIVLSEAVFPGWEGVDIAAEGGRLLGAPVEVQNDANLGALAEHRLGVARGHRTSVFVKVSSGVGAGIVLDDRLFEGADGTAGEIGHLTLDEQGPICRCGSRGCLEAYTSSQTVVDLVADQLPGADLTDVVAAATSGNIAAARALEDAGQHLGWGMASLANLLNPSVMVLGGDMAAAGELMLDSIRRSLRRHALDSVTHTPVLASALGKQASLLGAVLLAADRVDLVAETA